MPPLHKRLLLGETMGANPVTARACPKRFFSKTKPPSLKAQILILPSRLPLTTCGGCPSAPMMMTLVTFLLLSLNRKEVGPHYAAIHNCSWDLWPPLLSVLRKKHAYMFHRNKADIFGGRRKAAQLLLSKSSLPRLIVRSFVRQKNQFSSSTA